MSLNVFNLFDSVSVHKHAKKRRLGQNPAILTEKALSITHIYLLSCHNPNVVSRF